MISSDAVTPDLPPGLVEEYLAGMRTTLGLLASLAARLSAAGNDRSALETLHREIHKIHGSAGSYGFADVSRLAAGLEATMKDWVARPDDPEVDRGSLVRWFVARLAAMLGISVPPLVAPPATPPPPARAGPAGPHAAGAPASGRLGPAAAPAGAPAAAWKGFSPPPPMDGPPGSRSGSRPGGEGGVGWGGPGGGAAAPGGAATATVART